MSAPYGPDQSASDRSWSGLRDSDSLPLPYAAFPINGIPCPIMPIQSASNSYKHGGPVDDSTCYRRVSAPLEKLSETNLYIRGLLADTTDLDLQKMSEKFGKIVSTKAIIDNETNKCKGYGFVDFESTDSAKKAVEQLHADGKLVQMAKKQEEDKTNIYFSNLPDWIDDKGLREMLDPFGDVVSTRILRHQSPDQSEGKSKGVGFARMHLKEQCEQIIEKFNGHHLTDPNNSAKRTVKPLLVKLADGGAKKKKIRSQQNIRNQFQDELPLMPAFPMLPMMPNPNMSVAPYASYQTSFPTAQFTPLGVAIPGNADFSPQGYPIPVTYVPAVPGHEYRAASPQLNLPPTQFPIRFRNSPPLKFSNSHR
jgi:RNA recognition motif-containing protein